MFDANPTVVAALEAGNCVGVVFDTTFFAGIMGDAKWADYAMVLPSIDPERYRLLRSHDWDEAMLERLGL